MDRGAWQAAVHVCKRVRHDLATKEQQTVEAKAQQKPPHLLSHPHCVVQFRFILFQDLHVLPT